jgi:hypothetical protein
MECHCEKCSPLEYVRGGLLGMDALPPDDEVLAAADGGGVRQRTQLCGKKEGANPGVFGSQERASGFRTCGRVRRGTR